MEFGRLDPVAYQTIGSFLSCTVTLEFEIQLISWSLASGQPAMQPALGTDSQASRVCISGAASHVACP